MLKAKSDALMGEIMADMTMLKYGFSFGTEENDIDGEKKGEVQAEQALVSAAGIGDFDKIVELLSSSVSVDAEEYNKLLFYASKNYFTPLQIASANGYDKCVQLLIDHGADVNAKDRFDVTALHMAAEKGNYLCVKALLDAGADCCVRTKFSKSGCYTAVPHLGGTNPLHLAAANNHVECVKELIQYGADYNAVDELGRTSLYIAAQAGFDECVLAHLKNAVGRGILSLPSYETSDTPLHFAVTRGMVECVRELLYLGSDVNHINQLGCSPLHLALTPSIEKASVRMQILQLLVLEGYNTDINKPDAAGFTPLHYACFNGYRNLWCRRPELAKFLIAYGADVNIKNNQGTTLLELELKSNEKNSGILKYLVKSMLQLPRLKSLNVCPQREQSVPPPSVLAPIVDGVRFVNFESQFLPPPDTIPIPEMIVPQVSQLPTSVTVPSGIIRNSLSVRHHRLQIMRQIRHETSPQPLLMQANSPSMLKKQLWYENIASNPRSLQHHCRYVIRNHMGPMKLKHIRKLPIPNVLRAYLLFEHKE